jgi:hypothetical protein
LSARKVRVGSSSSRTRIVAASVVLMRTTSRAR